MARPTKFNAERGRAVVRVVAEVGGRVEAARAAGVGLRTLGDWLARARAGDPAMAEWLTRFEAAERWAWLVRARTRRLKDGPAARERWKRFKAARVAWHLDRLGPRAFWSNRLRWLAENGKARTFEATVARLRAEGFRIDGAP